MTVHIGDCRDVMRTMDAESVDSIVTDPPYGLSFMGKGWDHGVPGAEFWEAALRVAKPGAHLLAFGGTRTYHRLACAIEDAGWEIRDCIMWVYGSGFPKSHDVSKAIDREAGAEREVVGKYQGATNIGKAQDGKRGYGADGQPTGGTDRTVLVTAPATEAAKQWHGWGTALKPAWEPIIVARKPLCGTVAENVLRYGTGAVNVDGCRVFTDWSERSDSWKKSGNRHRDYDATSQVFSASIGGTGINCHPAGRWPANLIHDGSDEVVAGFPKYQSRGGVIRRGKRTAPLYGGQTNAEGTIGMPYGDTGSAARFFYCAKASKADREAGVAGVYGDYADKSRPVRKNHHPTVKPTALMRYLCRLVTPPSGAVLDPFMGSGSTGKAAIIEGFRFIGIEKQ